MQIILKIVLFAALGAGLIQLANQGLLGRGGKWNRAEPVRLKSVAADRGNLVALVSATGTLNAVTTVQVGSQLSGMVERLNADFNSRVKKGDLLAEIDPSTFAATVAQARADVQAARAAVRGAETDLAAQDSTIQAVQAAQVTARAAVRKAQATLLANEQTLKRQKTLAVDHFAAAQDVDTAVANRNTGAAEVDSQESQAAEADVKVATARAQRATFESKIDAAKAGLAQKEAALQLAEVNLGRTRILSPIDGVVVSRNVDTGQTVAASLQAPVLFTIANDLRRMQIDANVDESDIGRVKVDQPVQFTVDAYPDERFQGKVVQMRLQPIVSQNVVTYDTVIQVDNELLALRPGMTANVYIEVATAKDALRVPNAALSFKPPLAPGVAPLELAHGVKQVHKIAGDQAVPVEVKVGITDGSFTEIRSGNLAAGDRVAIELDTEPGGKAADAGPNNPFIPKRR